MQCLRDWLRPHKTAAWASGLLRHMRSLIRVMMMNAVASFFETGFVIIKRWNLNIFDSVLCVGMVSHNRLQPV